MSAIANQAKSTFYRGQVGPQGPRGPQGEKGDRGDRGDRGANGAQGVGILDATVDANGLLIVTLQDATTIVSNSSLTGPQGIQGIQGVSVSNISIDSTGNLNVVLDNGLTQLAGNVAAIATATINTSGDLILTKQNNATINAGNAIGPRGPQGIQGIQGNTGVITSVNGKSAISVTLTTADITESGKLYYTDARARAAFSATGSLSYDQSAGVFSYTAPTLNYDELTGLPTLSTVARTGSYTNLSDKPVLFSGAYADLTSKPTTISGYGITDAFTGSYTDLTNKPTIPTDVDELTDASGLLDHFSGSYNDLSNKPVLFSGAYADLSNKPTIPTTTTDITEGTRLYYTSARVDARITAADTIKSTALVPFGAVKLGDHLSVTGSAGVMAWHVADGKPVYHNGTAWFFMDSTPA